MSPQFPYLKTMYILHIGEKRIHVLLYEINW